MTQCYFLRQEESNYFCDADKTQRREIKDIMFTKNYCFDKQKFKKCKLYKEIIKEKEEADNCFITTACVKTKNLDDNCYELTCLREFRDNYLLKTPEGSKAVNHYYNIAPKILENINEQPDANSIYTGLYEDLVINCIKLIEDGKNEEAFKCYRDIVKELELKYM